MPNLSAKVLALRDGVIEQLEQFLLLLDRQVFLSFLALRVILQRLPHVSEDVVVVNDLAVLLLAR